MERAQGIFSTFEMSPGEAADEINRKSPWLIFFGVVLVALGLYACSHAVTTTVVSVFFIGGIMIAAGIVHFVQAFTSGKWRTFLLHLLVSVLYVVFGVLVFRQPAAAMVGITAFMAAFFFVGGIFRIFAALMTRTPQWGWVLFNGIVSTILGILVMANFPVSALWILGLYVGVDIVLTGWAMIMMGLALKNIAKEHRAGTGTRGPSILRDQTPAEA